MPQFDWSKPVPFYCPVCTVVDVIKNITEWLQFQRFKWESLLKNMPDSIMKRQIQAQLLQTNDMKKVREVLIREGYLTVYCESCQANMSLQQYERQGFKMVRIKNFLFEEKWFDTHREEVAKTIGLPVEKMPKPVS